MPIITDPPIQVDLTYFSRQSGAEINPMGPFLHGADLYLALVAQESIVGSTVVIYKSTDGGTTWVAQDTAGAPAFSGTHPWVSYDSASGIIFVVCQSQTPAFSWLGCAFDTNTDTYGTAAQKLVFAPAINDFGAFTYRQASTDNPFIYIENTTLKNLLESGGVFSGPTSIHNYGTPRYLIGGINDSADRGHFIYIDNSSNVFYNQLDVTFSLGTEVAFGTVADNKTGDIRVWDSKIVFAYTSTQTVLVEIGDGLADPVTFTEFVIETVTGSSNVSYARLTEDKDGNLVVFWTEVDYTTIPVTDKEWMSTFDGISAWGAKVLFYDEVDNPPPDSVDQMDQFIHTGDVIQLADGTWIFATALETFDGAMAQKCTGFILLGSGSPPPENPTLELDKIVDGGPAVPEDFTLIATGDGSPPDVVSGTGPTVGPIEVTAGVFELSELAPGGATWNESTGTWDNNANNWDDGDYTPVWDCGDAEMPTPTSVVVGGAGSPVVRARQVAPTDDPTFRSLLSGNPFEFSVGSSVYQLLWSSSQTLGMFKRAAASRGAAWTQKDAFNSPNQGLQSGYGKVSITGTVITVAYLRFGRGEMGLASFDTATDTWAPHTDILTLLSPIFTFAFGQQPSGDFVLVAGSTTYLYYAINSGGSWGAITGVLLNPTTILDGFIDASGAPHILVNSTGFGGTAYQRMDPTTFALGPASAVLAGTLFTNAGYPSIIPWGADSLAIGCIDHTGAQNGKVQVVIGTPLAAATLTQYFIATPATGETFSFAKAAEAIDGSLHSFYVAVDDSPVEIAVMQSDFDGGSTWSAPEVFYDAIAQPPVAGSLFQEISALDPVELVGGWAIGSAMETDQPTEVTTGQVLELGSSPNAVVCVITNRFTGPTPPPPGPPGPAESNPVGCWELLRLDVTLTPAHRLPTRGSVT